MSRVVAIGLVVVATAVMAMLWPARLGGRMAYVTTHGSSMEPSLRHGDLVAVRTASTYRVGDVVAYRSRLLDTVVLHRIVAVHDGRYTFKGDNNDWLDREQPTSDDLIGKLALRIPGLGRRLGWARLAIPPAAALLILGGGTGLRRRHRRRTRTRMHAPAPSAATSALAWRTAAVTLAISAAALGAGGTYAAASPTTEPARAKVSYTQRSAFSYAADVAPGPVYPDGRIDTGEPVYLRLANAIDVTASYDFDAAASHRIQGTLSLRAEVRDGTGWRGIVELAPPTPFDGPHAGLTGRLDLAAIQTLLADFRVAEPARLRAATPSASSRTPPPRGPLAATGSRRRSRRSSTSTWTACGWRRT